MENANIHGQGAALLAKHTVPQTLAEYGRSLLLTLDLLLQQEVLVKLIEGLRLLGLSLILHADALKLQGSPVRVAKLPTFAGKSAVIVEWVSPEAIFSVSGADR